MIIANVSTPLLGLVDTAVMGHLNNAHFLAAAALAGLIFSFLFWGFGFLRMGTTSLSARAFGEDNKQELYAVLLRALLVALSIACLILILQQPIATFSFYLINNDPTIEVLARNYFNIRIWSAPATLCQYVILGWFLGCQNTKIPLFIVISGNVCNIILDLILVMHYHMGTAGVALASVIAEYLAVCLGLWCLFRQRPKPLLISLAQLFQGQKIKAMLLINSHLFVRTLCLIFVFSFFTVQSGKLGSSLLAANAVLLNFQTFMAYVLDGFAHAAEALIGRAMGEKNKTYLQQSLNTTALWSFLIAVSFTVCYFFIGHYLINLLTHLKEVRDEAYTYLPWLIALPLISFIGFLMDGVFIGAALTRPMRNTIIFTLFLVFLPAWYMTQIYGNQGLWFALTLFMLIRSLIMLLYYLYYRKLLIN